MPKKKFPVAVADTDPFANMFADMEKHEEEMFLEGLVANSPSELLDGTEEDLWVKSRGWTPLEMLTHCYRNPWYDLKDRINAAKSVLEFIHRKLPQRIEIEGEVVETKQLKAENLSKLSDKELELFTKLLEKMDSK